MQKFVLTATLDGKTSRRSLYCIDEEKAIFDASFAVMNLAPKNRLWAKGKIVLKNAAKEEIAVMDAKEGA